MTVAKLCVESASSGSASHLRNILNSFGACFDCTALASVSHFSCLDKVLGQKQRAI